MKVDVVLKKCVSKPDKDLGATYEALFSFENLESFQALAAFTNQSLMIEVWKRQITFDDLAENVTVVTNNSEPTPIEALALENGHHNQPPTRGRKRKNEEDGP